MNIANQLTLLRIILIPIFVLILILPLNWGVLTLIGTPIPVHQFVATCIFAVASLTDFLDGYLARKYQLVTNFGKFFDPMADKLLVLAAFVILVQFGWVPAWVVIIILSRELMITGLRVLLAQHDGQVMAAAWPGKIKTFSQMFAIIFYLLNDAGFAQLNIPMADIMLYICLFFTVYSGIEYFYKGRFVFAE
ncbi:CDP-diacylglycerol--glycerol-3-phosphate 3-phosphatidyltransferase [Vaginisenegalia massiliensis]|uniref:CDP-diacylglycerol--glycerol-3-phosphate 3-phosphatidyltransferase n=1 Tax=Vaginisenegalia massiliensis TaxID=2058294 RepID=UPI000F5433CB|nr:CDP-diacylglycerol--glycerol-3-phosphate 3-phosphatidyltransferase [Vaginisenegalia massiliensis]